MVTWLNLTPHSVTLVDENGKILRDFLPSGRVVRLELEPNPYHTPPPDVQYPVVCYRPAPGAITALTAELVAAGVGTGVYGIVSSMVLQYAPDGMLRYLFAPDTGPGSVIRDKRGNVVGVRGLQQAWVGIPR